MPDAMRRASVAVRLAGRVLLLALLGVLLYSLTQDAAAPIPVALALAAFAVFSAVYPAAGFLTAAAIPPVATALVGRFDGAAWPETLVVAFLAGWTARGLAPRIPHPASRPASPEPLALAAGVF